MKLGIGSYTFTWSIGVPGYDSPDCPLTALELLETARRHDIRLVQLADNLPVHLMSDSSLQQLAEASQTFGIELELGTRGTEPQHLLTYLRLAGSLQSRLVRTLITSADLDQAESELRRILPAFEAAGVMLAVENHGKHTTRQLAGLFRRLDSPWLGCCLDTVNSFGALECPDTVIHDLLPYTVNLHLKDFDITRVDHQMGFTVLGTPAGCGRLDIPGLLSRLKQANRTPHAILELWTPFAGSVQETVLLEQKWFLQSLQNLREIGLH